MKTRFQSLPFKCNLQRYITAGAMDVRVGGCGGALLETKVKGEYVGEAAYLEFGGGGGGGGNSDPGSIRRRRRTADVIADVKEGASAAIITYDALDRLCGDHPLLAMAVFTRMATLAMARWRRALNNVEESAGGCGEGAGGGGGNGAGGAAGKGALKVGRRTLCILLTHLLLV